MNIEYGNLFSKAWKITWGNKWLWVLGFLAGLGGGSNFNFNSSSRTNTPIGPNGPSTQLPPEVRQMLEQLQRPEVIGIALTVVCVALIIAVGLFILQVIARGGLIGGIRSADDNGKVGLGEAWAIGRRYFWRMLGLEILQLLPIIVLVAIGGVIAIAFSAVTAGLGLLCILPVICILAILAIPYNLVFWLGGFGLVLEDLGVVDSAKRGWALLKTYPGPVLIVGAILFILLLIVSAVTLIPVALIAVPAMFAFAGDPQHPNMGLLAGSGLALLCLIPILWVVQAILTTWVYSVWTLLYRQLIIDRAPQVPVTPLPQTV
jgi:hypothetical protein